MKSTISLIIGLMLLTPMLAQADDMSPVGYWKTIPDNDAMPGLINIWQDKDIIKAKIVDFFPRSGHPEDLKPQYCDACDGKLKNAPIEGLQIIEGLTKNGDEWSGGKILDPGNGTYYKCYIKVVDGGKRLKTRGYIGISLLGRTQYWARYNGPKIK